MATNPDDPTDQGLDIDSAIDAFLRSKWKERVNKILISADEVEIPEVVHDWPLNRFR